LDPISEITGVQGRLRSLGYYDGEIDGSFSQDLAGAIESFQAAANLDPTGRLDEATRTELLKQYGS
jgi:N-acetylmuramoyl-L-alanine amidase